jgi:ATP-dependent DNA helicase PIF1
MTMVAEFTYEKFHERKNSRLEYRTSEDSEVSLRFDSKSAKVLLFVKTVCSRCIYSSKDLVIMKDLIDKEGKLTVILRDKHEALSFKSDSRGKLNSLASDLCAYSKAVTQTIAKDDSSGSKKEKENKTNEIYKMDIVKYKQVSPGVHASKDRVLLRSGFTPSKKKARDSATPPTQKGFFASSSNNNSRSAVDVENTTLTKDQNAVVTSALNGKNIFCTGGGGTGKSTLLQQLIKELKKKHGTNHVFVTATTGLSACSIGGITVHQFAGLSSPIDEDVTDMATMKKIAQDVKERRSAAVKRWRSCKVLIVDEISMMSRKVFETLHVIACDVCENLSVFGGIQVVFVGDFFQLPPVIRKNTSTGKPTASLSKDQDDHFCFQSSLWPRLIDMTHVLEKVFRQKDCDFIDALESVRYGHLSRDAKQIFDGRVRVNIGESVQLFTHNRDVDRINGDELSKLDDSEYSFKAVDKGSDNYLRMLQSSSSAPSCLILKRNAHILLTKNIDVANGLVNGARGVVSDFTPRHGYPIIRFDNGETKTITPVAHKIFVGAMEVANRTQIPCCLGWGMSIHKAQGMSIDKATLHLSRVFEVGQVYVALSRVRSIDGLSLDAPLREDQVNAHPMAKQFYKNLTKK